jgi:hypothetical protein
MLKSIRPQRNAWPRVRLSLARFAKLAGKRLFGHPVTAEQTVDRSINELGERQ